MSASDKKKIPIVTPNATPVGSVTLREFVANYRWNGNVREREKQ